MHKKLGLRALTELLVWAFIENRECDVTVLYQYYEDNTFEIAFDPEMKKEHELSSFINCMQLVLEGYNFMSKHDYPPVLVHIDKPSESQIVLAKLLVKKVLGKDTKDNDESRETT